MANAKQCDRCGGYFNPDCMTWDRVSVGKLRHTGDPMNVSPKTVEMDICPSCLEELLKFLGITMPDAFKDGTDDE